MKKKVNESSKPKERHIVSWSQEEDDILREHIRAHGTDNWTILASKFKDKTTRQCRRRWYTYLNSDFKRGGWSPEEDVLLCEAQRIFGNRWTEIAKVVSGRTDNAVKNRFNTLCKKRAKHESLEKENSNSSSVEVSKRGDVLRCSLNDDTTSDTTLCIKKQRRSHIPDTPDILTDDRKPVLSCDATNQQQLRSPPFTLLTQNLPTLGRNSSSHGSDEDMKDAHANGLRHKTEGAFLKKDDPMIAALVQPAELLNSKALKANSCESTVQKSLETASCEVSILFCSQPGLSQDSAGAGNAEYSTGSTSNHICDQTAFDEYENRVDGVLCEYPNEECKSPLEVAPVFRSLAAAIPSPKFSESERQFLLKTLGMESASPNPSITSSHPPLCKRALLHSL
ncbi:hypothetical protein DM860_000340 [Cuscuta australis]|uniref:Uncharacterized protein n=1 Tax=Cuscuta australis TaxID=267555 RepID=A0A328CX20_9ASTE|nr:hypothetical protein DM860_000340 [Cuscuta australis]